MRMLDLFSGLGGASRAMREAGWEVITVDNDPSFNPDICIDIRDFHFFNVLYGHVDLLWASPPCEEFSRWSMPWCRKKNPAPPSLDLLKATIRIIDEANPDYWVIENVRGAVPFFRPLLGEPIRSGSRYLWGCLPIIDPEPVYGKE